MSMNDHPTTRKGRILTLVSFALVLCLGLAFPLPISATQDNASPLAMEIDRRADEVHSKVVSWRRDIHEHPELGNREFRTAAKVAEHLDSLDIAVQTGVAHTGVVGVLEGGRPGPVVALRADMDALPVTEQVDLPFASRVRTEYNGLEVGVMHACGHDNHVAILMGVAEVLAGIRERLPGTVKFVFQPAEEGPPEGEEGGAAMMLREGVFENPRPEVVFGLHVSNDEFGSLSYRPRGAMASADTLRVVVRGRQTHGARPWDGVDPIAVASQILIGLQSIASRQVNVTEAASVITIGMIRGGVRWNIIPDEVEMLGTVRTLDGAMQEDIHERIRRTARMIAESAGATAEVNIETLTPVLFNDPDLAERMAPTLRRVAGPGKVSVKPATTTAEDFAFFVQEVPSLYFRLGVNPEGVDPESTAPNHSPFFFADEGALIVGVRALSNLVADYMYQQQ
jgi:amidohydrolase